jgi:hypothetical protein
MSEALEKPLDQRPTYIIQAPLKSRIIVDINTPKCVQDRIPPDIGASRTKRKMSRNYGKGIGA